MKIIGRILSCLCAFILAVAVLGSQLAMLTVQIFKNAEFYTQPADSIRADQIRNMEDMLQDLSKTYGFDAKAISDEVSAEDFASYGKEVTAFLGTLLEEQEEDAELIFPYYMTESMLDRIREDEGFQSTVEKSLQRTVSQNEIVTPVEQKATKLVFPLRPQLVIAAYNTVSTKIDIPKLVRLLDKWWVIPAAGCLLILLILVFDHKQFAAWTGSGLAAGALMILAFLIFANALDFASSAAQINPLFAKYLSFMWKNIWGSAAVFAAVMFVCGVALICCHVFAKRKTS